MTKLYVAFYNSKRTELKAASPVSALKKAAKFFKAAPYQTTMISVVLAADIAGSPGFTPYYN